MNQDPQWAAAPPQSAAAGDGRPILIVPYMWIGDFVRCHTVVRVLKARFPGRPVDMLSAARTLPLVDYMPGVRKAVLADLPRGRLALAQQRELADRLRQEGYGSVLVMPRTWKSALAPYLAGIPQRTGFVGEGRFILLNDLRWGERKLERMIDRKVALALPGGAPLPADYPLPELRVPPAEIAAWRETRGSGVAAVALCPATVGPGRSWPVARYAELAQALTAAGNRVWVLGSGDDRPLAMKIALAGGPAVQDLTGPDLRQAIVALAAADAVVANDSGLLHVAAALGSAAIGIFGPTRPFLTGPLNLLAAAIEGDVATCTTCGQPGCARLDHRRTDDVPLAPVLAAVREVLERTRAPG
jgi:heptosyltransferase II